jgi:hypothetical protein
MAFKDLFKKKYNQNVWCNNCNSHSEVSIPKGVTLTQYVESGACPNCGCITLVAGYKQIDEFKQQPPPESKPKIKFFYKPLKPKPGDYQRPQRTQRTSPPVQRAPTPQPQRAQLPQPRPSNRPANLPPPVERRPIPDFTPKGVYTNEIDFWTGTKKRGDYYENS